MIRSIALAAGAALVLSGCASPSVESPTPISDAELQVAKGQVITVYKSPT